MENQNTFQVLIVEPASDVMKSMVFALENEFGAEVFEASDADGALNFMSMVQDIKLIIIGAVESYPDLLIPLSELDAKTKVIIGVESGNRDAILTKAPGFLGFLPRFDLLNAMIPLIKRTFFKGEIAKGMPGDYSKFRSRLLYQLGTCPCDIFIKLSEEKYLKIFSSGSMVELDRVKNYVEQKKVDSFFVTKLDAKKILEALQVGFEKMISAPVLDQQGIEKVTQDLEEACMAIIQVAGVTEEVKAMTKATVKMTLKSLGKSPTANQVLRRFQLEPGKYIPQHSLMLSEVACFFATKVNWQSDLTFQKLILASMYHDICLKSHEVAKCATLEEYKSNKELALLESLENFKLHPIHGADMVNQLGEIPPDVDVIIRQHHERPDGSGFPKGEQHGTINPLSALFIIAHDYLNCVRSNKPEKYTSPLTFIEQKREYYNHGVFKRILKELEVGLKKDDLTHLNQLSVTDSPGAPSSQPGSEGKV